MVDIPAISGLDDATQGRVMLLQAGRQVHAPVLGIGLMSAGMADFFRGVLHGLTLSNNGSDATNDIDIAAGVAASGDTTPVLLELASTLTKRLDASWAVGTNQGGLDTGSIANTTYHIWLIRRSDTGVVDALFSTSASSPTMPANYDQKRRIGSIIRSGGAILGFSQLGDEFLLNTPVLDVESTNPGTSAVLSTLTVPSGVKVHARIAVNLQVSAAAATLSYAYISSPDSTDVAPTLSASAPLNSIVTSKQAANNFTGSVMLVRTNTSAQIRSRLGASDASTFIRIATTGWVDTRGRLF